ncbi:MAG TPA: addiction module protein [Kofleriaceae bacterium]|jgi:hypothetical protein
MGATLELIRGLDSEHDADAAEAWDEESERRAAEVEAGTASTMTLDEYRDHVRTRRAARARRDQPAVASVSNARHPGHPMHGVGEDPRSRRVIASSSQHAKRASNADGS